MVLNIKYLVFIMVIFCPVMAAAQNNEELYHTRYSDITYDRVENFNAFEKKIKGGSYFFKAHGPDSSYVSELVDGIVEKVEFYLDMYPKGLKVKIIIHEDSRALEKAYWGLGIRGNVPAAFYNNRNKTIYVNAQDVNSGIMAHEFAHAVICAYFNHAVPEKTQEILAHFVDEQVNQSQ